MIIANILLLPLNFLLKKSTRERHEKIKAHIIMKSLSFQLKPSILLFKINGINSKMSE